MNSSQSSSICLVCKEIIGNSKLITCSSCAKIYHQVRKFHLIKDCLLYTEDEIKKYSISKCDVCRTPKEQTNRIRCFICNKNDGILKKIRDKTDRWGHIGCVKYFFIPLKFENGFTFFKLDKALPDDTWIGDCSICSKSSKNDFLVKCNKQSCNKYFHSKCLKNKPTLIDSLKEGLMTYCIVHCDEHKSLKKTGDKLQDVKTYGKNINNTEGNFNSNSQLTTRTLPNDEITPFTFHQKDIILNSVPIIINDKKDTLKIKMKFTDKVKDSNGISDGCTKSTKPESTLYKLNNRIKYKPTHDPFIFNHEIDFVNTYIKCNICGQDIDTDIPEKIKKCSHCLNFCHFTCAKDFGEKVDSSQCRKCQADPLHKEKCLACGRSMGYMVKCDSRWLHIFCLLNLNCYFYEKTDKRFQYSLDPQKLKKIHEICCVCKSSNAFTKKCQRCDLNMHPYCGLINNFNYQIVDRKVNLASKFEFKILCDSNHKFFKGSLNQQIKQPVRHIRKRVLSYPKTKPNPRTYLPIEEKVKSLNYGHLRNFISEGKIDKFLIFKTNNFTWEITDPYFMNLSKADISRLLDISSEEEKIDMERFILNEINLKDTNESEEEATDNKRNNIICLFKVSHRNYLMSFDISKSQQIKLRPDFVNFMTGNIDENGNRNQYVLQNKRKRTKVDSNEFFYLFKKNVNVNVEDKLILNETHTDNTKNLREEFMSPNLKIKLIVNDDCLATSNTNLVQLNLNQIQESNNTNLTCSYETNKMSTKKIKKILNKIIPNNLVKLSRVEYRLVNEEMKAYEKLQTEFPIKAYNDIDKEILIKSELLSNVYNRNVQLIRKNIDTSKVDKECQHLDHTALLSTYKNVSFYTSLRRRLINGCETKSLTELLKARNITGKSYQPPEELSHEELKKMVIKMYHSDADCCVCLYSDPEDVSPIVFCDMCNVSMHQQCYGIKEIPEKEYYCDLCTLNKGMDSSCILCCILCGKSKGAMKLVDKTKETWAHVTCILFSDCVKFDNFQTFTLSTLKDELDLKNIDMCCICSNSIGELFKCQQNCGKSYHFFCAYFSGLRIKISEMRRIDNTKKLIPNIIDCGPECYDQKEKDTQKDIRTSTYQKDFQKNLNEDDTKDDTPSKEENTERINGEVFYSENDSLKKEISQEELTQHYESFPSSLTIPLAYDKQACMICFKLEDNRDNLVKCDKCRVPFHSKCYSNDLLSAVKIKCDYCRFMKRYKNNSEEKRPPRCLLCFNEGGAVKKCYTEKFKSTPIWVHLLCMNFYKGLRINRNKIYGIENVKSDIFNTYQPCQICNLTYGYMVRCCVNGCHHTTHPYCVYLSNLTNGINFDNLSMRCELHSVLYDLCMSKEIYKHSNKLQEGGMYTQREIVNLVECINPQVDNDGHKLFSQITTMLSLESIERLVKIIKS